MRGSQPKPKGNVAAGILGEVSAFETTRAEVACGRYPVGAVMVRKPGRVRSVVRRSRRENAPVRPFHNPTRYRLEIGVARHPPTPSGSAGAQRAEARA